MLIDWAQNAAVSEYRQDSYMRKSILLAGISMFIIIIIWCHKKQGDPKTRGHLRCQSLHWAAGEMAPPRPISESVNKTIKNQPTNHQAIGHPRTAAAAAAIIAAVTTVTTSHPTCKPCTQKVVHSSAE